MVERAYWHAKVAYQVNGVVLAAADSCRAYLIVRPRSGRADVLASAVRGAIARVDREQLVSVRDVMTLDDVAAVATAAPAWRASRIDPAVALRNQ